jgi:hypothetical protein
MPAPAISVVFRKSRLEVDIKSFQLQADAIRENDEIVIIGTFTHYPLGMTNSSRPIISALQA